MNQVLNAVSLSESARQSGILPVVERNRKALVADTKRRKGPWKNSCNLSLRITYSAILRLLAQMLAEIFGSHPYYTVEGRRKQDEKYATVTEKFLEGLCTQVLNLEAEMDPVFNAMLVDGTAWCYVGWRHEETEVLRHAIMPKTDESGNMLGGYGWSSRSERRTTFDGPELRFLPIEAVGVIPANAKDVQRAQGVYLFDSYSGNELMMLQEQGLVDKAAIDKMRGYASDLNQRSGKASAERRNIDGIRDGDEPFQTRDFEVSVIFWKLPVSEKRVAEDWVLWIHEPSRTLLYARPNEAFDRRRPLVRFAAFPDVTGIYGNSVGDIVGDVQEAMTAIMRQVIDEASIIIHAPIAMDVTAAVQGEAYEYAPGQVWKVYDVNKIRPISSPSQVSVGLQLNQILQEYEEKPLGLSGQAYGVPEGGRKSATESQVLSSNQSVLFSMLVRRVRRSMNEIAKLLMSLCYEYAGNESVRDLWEKLIGEDEDPTGSEVERVEVLGGDYLFNISGTTDTTSRPMRQALIREVYDRLMNHPLVQANPLLQYAIARRYLNELQIRMPEELIGQEAQIRQAMADQARAQLTSMSEDTRTQVLAAQGQMGADMQEQAPQMVGEAVAGAMGVPEAAA